MDPRICMRFLNCNEILTQNARVEESHTARRLGLAGLKL